MHLFELPYERYMNEKKYIRLEDLVDEGGRKATEVEKAYNAPSLSIMDLKTFQEQAIYRYMTFAHGECGFVASYVPRSFVKEFLSDKTN